MPSNALDAAYRSAFLRKTLNIAVRTNGAASGTAVDTAERGGVDSVLAYVVTGTITDGTHTFTIEESADGSTGWATVPGGRIQGSLPAVTSANSNTRFECGVATSLQYLRISVNVTGATSGGTYLAGFVMVGSHYEAH